MYKIYSLLLLLPLLSQSQSKHETDSSWDYQSAMGHLERAAIDSVKKTPEYIALKKKYNQAMRKSNNYSSFAIFTEFNHSDYRDFNKSITANGFPALDDHTFRIGFGLSTKEGHLMFNLFYAIAGINNVSSYNGTKIKTSFGDIAYTDVGYDLLNSRSFSLYPYAGLSWRISTLRYTKDASINNNFTDVSNILINDQSVQATSNKVGYHAGIGFDIRLSRSTYPDEGSNVRDKVPLILFFKFGTNQAIGQETYKIHGIKYKPGIRQGDWGITVGLKFP